MIYFAIYKLYMFKFVNFRLPYFLLFFISFSLYMLNTLNQLNASYLIIFPHILFFIYINIAGLYCSLIIQNISSQHINFKFIIIQFLLSLFPVLLLYHWIYILKSYLVNLKEDKFIIYGIMLIQVVLLFLSIIYIFIILTTIISENNLTILSISWISFIGYLGVLIGYVSYPKIVQEDSTNLIILFINNQIFDITNRGKIFLIFVIIFSSLVFITLIINLNPLFITIWPKYFIIVSLYLT